MRPPARRGRAHGVFDMLAEPCRERGGGGRAAETVQGGAAAAALRAPAPHAAPHAGQDHMEGDAHPSSRTIPATGRGCLVDGTNKPILEHGKIALEDIVLESNAHAHELAGIIWDASCMFCFFSCR